MNEMVDKWRKDAKVLVTVRDKEDPQKNIHLKAGLLLNVLRFDRLTVCYSSYKVRSCCIRSVKVVSPSKIRA